VISILVDTNIFMDVLFRREEYAATGKAVLNWSSSNPGKAWMAWHSLANLDYLGKKHAGRSKTEAFIDFVLNSFEISATDTRSARLARMLPIPDFEDAMQVAAADKVKANFIITRNLKDYNKSPIPAISPEEFVERFV
jgi:predicted nucleic acid-binding protein